MQRGLGREGVQLLKSIGYWFIGLLVIGLLIGDLLVYCAIGYSD
jgi:hypothetical protein